MGIIHKNYSNLKNIEKIFLKMHYEQQPIYDEQSARQYEYYLQEVEQPEITGRDQRRPGKEPSLPDNELSPEELRRRNNRRRRNREAAARVRERRIGKMKMLEEQVSELKTDQKNLRNENESLRQQLAKLQKEVAGGKGANPVRPLHRLTRQVSNTEAPPPHELPTVPKTENMEVFQTDQPKMICTPGGTFVLTPIRQDVQFSFPETQTVRQSSSDSEYKMILLNL